MCTATLLPTGMQFLFLCRLQTSSSDFSQGYTGILCGSCSSNYGRSTALRCTKCPQRYLSILVAALEVLWLFLMFCFFIWRALKHYNFSNATCRMPSTSSSQRPPLEPNQLITGIIVNPLTENAKVRIFEVDFTDSQAWQLIG